LRSLLASVPLIQIETGSDAGRDRFDQPALDLGAHEGNPDHSEATWDEAHRPAGGPANRRAELWMNMRKALEAGRFRLPDDNSLQADLVSCGYRHDSSGRLLLESKQDMRRRGVRPPDMGDAAALTFSGPGGHVLPERKPQPRTLGRVGGLGSWMAT
jgi:hypothetical protein